MSDSADYTAALVDGPWKHQQVPANGSRFHVATAGPDGSSDSRPPLVILLHDVPQFWWAWRHQLTALADAGLRVAAMDLRGAGASDKPPSGHDIPTRTRDVAGVVRSLGHDRAVVVGSGTGGVLAWSMATLQPAVTAGIAALGAPHPMRLHVPGRRLLTTAARRQLALAQLPSVPERRLRDGDLVARLLAAGAARPFPDADVEVYREVMRIPFAARSAAEALRWLTRCGVSPDGRRFLAAIRRPIGIPVLQVHGDEDGLLRRRDVDADGAAHARDFQFESLPGAGHYLPEEAPDEVTEMLLDWLGRMLRR